MTVDPRNSTPSVTTKIGMNCIVPLGPEWNSNEFVRSTVTDLGDPPWYRYTLSDRLFSWEAKPQPPNHSDPRPIKTAG